jgi:hypothetical protein
MKMKMRFFYLLIINSILSHFILYTPVNLHERLYDGTLISMLISFVIQCINAYMVIYVYNKFKDNNLVEIHKKLFGKFIGSIFTLILLAINVVISFFMYRGLIEMTIKYMLPATPVWLVSVIIIILPYINLFNNDRSYLRYIGLISAIILFYTGVQLIIIAQNINYHYIKGVFIHASLKPDLIAIGVAGFFFSGLSHLSVFNPVFNKINWKKACFLFLTLGVFTALSAVLIQVAIWGPLAVQNIQLVWVATSDTLSMELFLIERALYILMPLFFMLAGSQVLNYGHVAYGLIKILVPSKIIHFILINIISILFIIFSVYIQETQKLIRYATIAMVGSFYAYHGLSLLLFIACKLKERRMNNEKIC